MLYLLSFLLLKYETASFYKADLSETEGEEIAENSRWLQ